MVDPKVEITNTEHCAAYQGAATTREVTPASAHPQLRSLVLRFAYGYLVIFLVLFGCDTAAPTQSAVGSGLQVQETSSGPGGQAQETIRLNNCGGKAAASQMAERGSTVQIEAGAQIGVGNAIIQAAVTGRYASGAYSAKSITLTAPPDTNMEFTLRWMLEDYSGQITGDGITGAAIYHFLVPLSVEIIAQRDQGCGQALQSPQAVSPTQPQVPPAASPTVEERTGPPTQAVSPTQPQVPPAASPTVEERTGPPTATVKPPEPTAIPDTPPGTVLEVGQIWRQSGIELQVRQVAYNMPSDWGGAGIRIAPFYLTNTRPDQVIITYSSENFSAIDNLGRSIAGGWGCLTCNEIFQPFGRVSHTYASGETSPFAEVGFKLDVTDASTTEVIITATGISSISNARWRIPINH